MAADWNDSMDGLDSDLLAAASGRDPAAEARAVIPRGGTLQRTGSGYSTAVKVQEPRNLQLRAKMLLAEAKLAGEAFYYGWGSGKDKVLGPSIGLAMAAARIWGNCAVEPLPIEETEDSWVLSVNFIDLETGFTLGRQFRQAKGWTVHGKFDEERKDDIRFQIGQSKAARNVICNALPKWLIDAAIREAQTGVRERIEKYITEHGLPAAVDLVIAGLSRAGVPEAAILAKCEVAERIGLTLDHVVMLRGDLYALQNGTDRAETLYPLLSAATASKRKAAAVSDLDAMLDKSDHADREAAAAETAAAAKRAANPPTEPAPKKRGRPKKESAAPAPAPTPEPTPEPPLRAPEPTSPPRDETAPRRDEAAPRRDETVLVPDDALAGDEPPAGVGVPIGDHSEWDGEPTLPDGFDGALAQCRAVGDVDTLYSRWSSSAASPAILDAMTAACEVRRSEIRAMFRLGR